jgi:hypothetical protein
MTMTDQQSKTRAIAPWLTRLMELWLVAALILAIGQLFIYAKPTDILANKATPAELNAYLQSLSKTQVKDLMSNEQKAMAANPLDLRPLKNLAALLSAAENKDQSESLIGVIAERSLQDPGTDIAALDLFLKMKNYAAAMRVLDALSRIDGAQFPTYAGLMSKMAATPDAEPVLVKYLTDHPKWRVNLIGFMADDPKLDVNILYGLFTALTKAGSPPTRIETQSFLRRLIADKAYDKAYFVWLDQLNENELRKVSGVFDGGFEFDFGDRFFDWTSVPIANVQASLVTRESGANDRAFALEFSSGRTPFAHFSQLLKLTPGDYVFAGESKVENLENEKGMVWRIYCLPVPGPILATTTGVRGTQPWTAFTLKLTVPEHDCETQLLRLELNAVAVIDMQVSGRVLFDNLKIERSTDSAQ